MFTNIKELEKYLINDENVFLYYQNKFPKINIDFDCSKILWGCGIYEYDKKVGMNYIFPLMVYHNLKNDKYILFDIDFEFNNEYHYVEEAKEKYKIGRTHIRTSSEFLLWSELNFLHLNKFKDLSEFDIKLFDNAGDAEQFRKETEKTLRKKIKVDKEADSNNMVTLEDIANKFNIDINKLIIKGIWNDPYNKKRKEV